MIRFFVWFGLLLCPLLSLGQNTPARHRVEITSSEFDIFGRTNINRFHCILRQEYAENTLDVTSYREGDEIFFSGLRLSYPIDDFDCGIKAMSKDLQNTLKSSIHPNLFLEINSIILNEGNEAIEELEVSAIVTIKLGGVERKVSIEQGKVVNYSDDLLSFFGQKQLNMTNFNIEPPEKFLGMIKVADELSVAFNIRMQTQVVEQKKPPE